MYTFVALFSYIITYVRDHTLFTAGGAGDLEGGPLLFFTLQQGGGALLFLRLISEKKSKAAQNTVFLHFKGYYAYL